MWASSSAHMQTHITQTLTHCVHSSTSVITEGPSTDEAEYTGTLEQGSNETSIPAATGTDFKYIMAHKKSQSQEATCYMIQPVTASIGEPTETKSLKGYQG